MKVGIITFHRPINFGAALQAIALNKKVKESDLIDYRNSRQEAVLMNMEFKTAIGLKNKIKALVFRNINKKRISAFNQFFNNNAKLSTSTYNSLNIKEGNKEYDLFITGSDQVWNLNLNNEDYNYFLKFVDNDLKKLSYASSFGYSIVPEKYIEKTKEQLKKYREISVREKQAVNIVKELIERDVKVVLDPTLLLNKEEWLTMAKKPNYRLPGKYILLYAVSPTKEDYRFARIVSKKSKMKVVLINYNNRYVCGMKNLMTVGPAEFLWLFNNAECVLTNSFHGTVFSLNFNKRFLVRLSTKPNNGNSRIENIIEISGLKDRYMNDDTCNNIMNYIDWENVNCLIEKEREKSIEFINKSILVD